MKTLGALTVVLALFVTGCGSKTNTISSSKTQHGIIGGELVSSQDTLSKSIVGIYDDNEGFTCTGTLLPDNMVVTAAHCVGKKTKGVFIVFAPDMESLLNLGPKFLTHESVRAVVGMRAHPDFHLSQDPSVPGNDIALMKYEGTTPEGYVATKVVTDLSLIKPGAETILAGYGVEKDTVIEVNPKKIKNLQKLIDAGVVFCDSDDARFAKECVREELEGPAILKATTVVINSIPNDKEVILDQTQGHAACSGDSGGPAFIKVGDEYQLWGATSRSGLGCNTDIVYTNVLSYADWIKTTASLMKIY
ncbi:MAG: trypsin-like serine protease [Bdellovibrio sp.]|nr:trypsin-like serine protease [Bdellovibrio sp.]